MTKSRKKILFHLHAAPIPVSGGATRRLFGYLQYFRDRFDYLCVEAVSDRPFRSDEWNSEQQRSLLEFVPKLHIYQHHALDYGYAKAKTGYYQKLLKQQIPVDCDYATPPDYVQFFQTLAHHQACDFILINYLSFAHLAIATKTPHTKTFIDIHDIACQNRLALKDTGFRKHLKFDYASNFAKEVQLLNQFDGVIINSQKEMDDLSTHLDFDQLRLIPHLVEDCQPTTRLMVYSHRTFMYDLLFVGSGHHTPNVEGINFFLASIFPKIVDQKPDVRLAIAGTVSQFIQVDDSLKANIECLGYVEDLSALYLQSKVFICPLLNGAGTKVKLQEAMAYATPIVTTTVGASGLSLVDGINAIVTDQPDQFANQVLQLLSQPELAQKLSEAASMVFNDHYSNAAVYSKLDRLFGIG
ncbi:MAG: glycosyltransferase family 4 protein [Leptolyngbyaceae cyanobacterium RU_5_1]|nr:glycosyltransferase family 4 protein [Leptolyngbyaceae cyanobacterium RU_5_1]